jgi:membrane protein
MTAQSRARAFARRWTLRNIARALWRVTGSTVETCLKYRVTGLAGEAAFFAILSLPPLIFAMAGSVGYVFNEFSADQVQQVRHSILDMAGRALTPETVDSIIKPTLNEVLRGGRYDVISLGFILALWSGSRALSVFVDTITIMYGLDGRRGIIQTRALAFLLYVLGMITGVITIPLVVAGPHLVDDVLTGRWHWLTGLYWPIVIVLSICFLTTLYHVSVPVRTSWTYNVPGAIFTMFCWIVGSALLRFVLVETAEGSTSIYGPLAAPIAILTWLYVLSIAVLIGAAINAAFDQVWPQKTTTTARSERLKKLDLEAMLPWRVPGEADKPEEDRKVQ